MKFTATAVLALAAQLAPISAGVAPTVAEECGALGVMSSTDAAVEAGVNPSDIRKCKEHPLSVLTTRNEKLAARDCWFGDSYGCTDGYCWKRCGTNNADGLWCWLAWANGLGEWRQCKGKGDCQQVEGSGCGQGGCDKCGCSC